MGSSYRRTFYTIILFALVVAAVGCAPEPAEAPDAGEQAGPVTGTVASADGVKIAYTSAGSGSPAIVFIHGGFADQSFWSEQVPLAETYRLVTLDLAGHGASGSERETWSMDAFGEDVRAVVEALELDAVVLVGNSLGGPVGLNVAQKLPDRVRGLIAVDTLQDVQSEWPEEQRDAFVQAMRDDFDGTCKMMVRQLLLEGTDEELYAWIEGEMCSFDPEVALGILGDVFEHELAPAFAGSEIPIRAILGEITPLNLEGNRELHPDFDAVVMEGCGHYPQLENPAEFNRHLVAYVEELQGR